MVEVGKIELVGQVEDTGISQSFNDINQNFKEVKVQADHTNASLSRTASVAKSLGKSLVMAGTAGLTAMTALATQSPALAGTLAKLQISTFQLSNTIGRQFKPAFEGVNNLLINFNAALLNHDSTVSQVASSVGESFSDLGNFVTGEWSQIEHIIPKTVGAIAGAALGMPFGYRAMVLGAYLGSMAGGYMAAEKETRIDKEVDRIYSGYSQEVQGGLAPDAMRSFLSDPFVDIGPAYTPGIKQLADWFVNLIYRSDDKETTFATSNGISRGGAGGD